MIFKQATALILILLCAFYSARADQSDNIPTLTDTEKRVLSKSQSKFLTAEELPISLEAGRKEEIAARMRCDLKLNGKIEEENAGRLATQIRNVQEGTLCLNSEGGSIAASKLIVDCDSGRHARF